MDKQDERGARGMSKVRYKKLNRLLRIIEKRNLEGKPYRYYWDVLFCDNVDFLDRFSGDNVNDRIITYKLWGVV